MTTGARLLYAHDPVPELDERVGLMIVEAALAATLVAECRAEAVDRVSNNDSMRFVDGSPANLAARDALRQAREAALAARKRRAAAERPK